MAALHWLDIFILAGFLSVSLAIGVIQAFTGGRQHTMEEYLLDNRRLKIFPTTLSLLASARSAVTMLGMPAEIYQWGTQIWFAGDIVGNLVSGLIVERFILPWLYNLKMTSTYEYLELRYESKAVRRLVSLTGIVGEIMRMGFAFVAPSVAMQVVAGVDAKTSFFLMATFCTVYTAMGGMRGVVWTDVLQSLIMFGGMLFILVQGVIAVGSFQEVIDISKSEGRLFFAKFNPDPSIRLSFWSMVFNYVVGGFTYLGTNQVMLQRYASMPTLRAARLVLLIYLPLIFVFNSMCGLVGLSLFAFFSKNKCDPLEDNLASSSNGLFPLFIKMRFSSFIGTNGFVLMLLYSGSLSTISSILNGCSANLWEDFLKPWLGPKISEYKSTLVCKAFVCFFAAAGVAMAFLIIGIPGNVLEIATIVFGAIQGPVAGIYLLGGLSKTCEWIGALVGGIAGFCVSIVLGIGSKYIVSSRYHTLKSVATSGCSDLVNETLGSQYIKGYSVNDCNKTIDDQFTNMSRPFYLVTPLDGIQKVFGISPFWYGPIGFAVSMVVGYIISHIVLKATKQRVLKVDERYLISLKTALGFSKEKSHYTKPHEMETVTSVNKNRVAEEYI